MLPQEQMTNYITSIWNYIEGRYSETAKYFYGLNTLDTSNLTEWVQFSWQTSTRQFERQTDQTYPGSLVHANIVANIYVKPKDEFLRIVKIRDVVVALLRRAIIEVRDWMGTKAVISQMTGENLLIDSFIDTQNDVDQHVLVFDYLYLEQFERAHR